MGPGEILGSGQLVNVAEDTAPRLVEFGDSRQIMGALHANGSMLLRSRHHQNWLTPEDFSLNGEEAFRERMIPHPLLYVPQPFANFGRTIQTARSKSRSEWGLVQTMLAATFLKNARFCDARLAALFADARGKRPPVTTVLLLAALAEPACRDDLLRHANFTDWVLLLRGLGRRPNVLWRVIRSRWRHRNWWRLLDQYTAARFEELRDTSHNRAAISVKGGNNQKKSIALHRNFGDSTCRRPDTTSE
jgi:hypothetical protein